MLPESTSGGWTGAPAHVRAYAAERAAVAGDLPSLLEDAHYRAGSLALARRA